MTSQPLDHPSSDVDEGVFETPCSLPQARFWLLDQLRHHDPALNVAVRWSLTGRVEHTALQGALQAVVDRHEVLRTSYREGEGLPVQAVWPAVTVQLSAIDLTLLTPAERTRELHRISLAQARTPFDLSQAPPLRTTLLTLEPDEHVLLVTMHHIACDGWSMGILAREVIEIYDAVRHGRRPDLPDLPIQYADYSDWQGRWLAARPFEQERAYWTEHLGNLVPFELPADRPRSAGLGGGAVLGTQLPRSLTDAMAEVGRGLGCTFFMVGTTALLALLHRLTDRDDIVVCMEVAGRDRIEVEGLIGAFAKSVPLRVRLSGTPSLREALLRVRDVVQAALGYQHTPVEELIAIARPLRDPARSPLSTINVICQRNFTKSDVRPDIALHDMPSLSSGALNDLAVYFVESPAGWEVSFEYSTELFEDATMARHLGELQALFDAMVRDPDQPIAGRGAQAVLPPAFQGTPPAAPDGLLPDPRAAIEARLAEIWCRTLDVEKVGRTDDFFSIGGHSLLALRLLSQITSAFGRRLDLNALYQSPTIESLAGRLLEEAGTHGTLVTLQGQGTRTPIVALHDTFVYRDLSARLGADQPFFAVPSPAGIEEDRTQSFAEIAAHFVRALQAWNYRGPVIVLGFCFAGRLAFEVARQLRQGGRRIELVVAIDAWAPGHLGRQTWWQALLARQAYRCCRLAQHARALWRGGSARAALIERSRMLAARHRRRFGVASHQTAAKEAEDRMIAWIDGVAGDYAPERVDVPVHVIYRDTQPQGPFLDPTLGWGDLVAGPLWLDAVPASHGTILHGASAEHIAGLIRSSIDRLRAGA